MSGRDIGYLQKASDALDFLLEQVESIDFRYPVNWKMLELYDYPLVIKKKMNLIKIKEKIRKYKYTSFEQFKADVQLIWDNCRTYNKRNSKIARRADVMEKKFEDFCKKSVLLPSKRNRSTELVENLPENCDIKTEIDKENIKNISASTKDEIKLKKEMLVKSNCSRVNEKPGAPQKYRKNTERVAEIIEENIKQATQIIEENNDKVTDENKSKNVEEPLNENDVQSLKDAVVPHLNNSGQIVLQEIRYDQQVTLKEGILNLNISSLQKVVKRVLKIEPSAVELYGQMLKITVGKMSYNTFYEVWRLVFNNIL